jgi:hypothetical protein
MIVNNETTFRDRGSGLMKKRKPTIKEDWADFRIFLYGFMRMWEIVRSGVKAFDEFGKKFKYDDIINDENIVGGTIKSLKNKKSYFVVVNSKTGEEYELKIEGVKHTIKRCLALKIYWKKRKKFFKDKIFPEKNDKDYATAYNDEAQQYFRTITSYITTDKYDNRDFYIKNKYFEDISSELRLEEGEDIEFVKERVRTNIFSVYAWEMFKQSNKIKSLNKIS